MQKILFSIFLKEFSWQMTLKQYNMILESNVFTLKQYYMILEKRVFFFVFVVVVFFLNNIEAILHNLGEK